MKTLWMAAILAGLVVPAQAAVNKDGGQPSVNPCGAGTDACAGNNPVAALPEPVSAEPVVIYLDANGDTLVRLPLSRFRKAHPDAVLPPELTHGN